MLDGQNKKEDKLASELSKWTGDTSDDSFIDSEILNKTKFTHFFKSLVFQAIFDKDFDRDERDVMLVIFRKTIHFNKDWDRISIGELSKMAGPCEHRTKEAVKRLKSKAFIDIKISKGGRSSSRTRFNAYRLSGYLIDDVRNKYRSARREHEFYD